MRKIFPIYMGTILHCIAQNVPFQIYNNGKILRVGAQNHPCINGKILREVTLYHSYIKGSAHQCRITLFF